MPTDRMRRVNEAVREVISEVITAGMKDPRIGFVTVTGVETSPDLRHATVFVSVFGDEQARDDTLAGLEDSRKVLQSELARQLRIKNTPRLRFSYDDSAERSIRISHLIDQVDQETRTTMSDRDQIIDRIQASEKFLLTTHENPDGDAIGSLVGMNGVLQSLGKDTVMFVRANEFPLPHEYRYLLANDQVIHAEPDDLAERTVIFLDCGNFDRMEVDFLKGDDVFLINIDHHHDNTRFGTLNHVVGHASCTAEIIYDLLDDLAVELTPQIAEALYVAMVTDTGRFMYENTGAATHRMAADLIERGGVSVHKVYSRLFEDQPFGKIELLGRALNRTERYDEGLLTVTRLEAIDFDETKSEETFSEGVVDFVRSVAGTAVGALFRQLTGEGRRHLNKISLRSTDGRVDVSVIARGFGGGGHRQAAGATTDLPYAEVIEIIREGIRQQLLPDAQPAS